jgi:FemAB-related protein (PEP-CTERM system-associated)
MIRRINPCDYNKWDQYVISHPSGTLYHHSLWKEVLEESYGYEPFYMVSLEAGDEISGAFPLFLIKSSFTGRRLVSLPFSNVGGPLTNSHEVSQALVNAAVDQSHLMKCDYVEIRTQGNLNGIEKWGFHRSDHFNSSIVELAENPDVVWSNFQDRNLRTEIRKAIRSGIRVRMEVNGEHLKEFYFLLLKTRRKHGIPPQPYSFFKKLWDTMSSRNLIRLLLADYQGKIIVGLILLVFKDRIIAAYMGSDDHFLHMRPHQLIYWKAMEWGCENGFHYFDFLRTARENQGLLYFKKRWGGRNLDIPYFFYPKPMGMTEIQEKSLKYRLSTALWRKIPSFITPWGSRTLYRHFG